MPGSKIGYGGRRGKEGVPRPSQENGAKGELIHLFLSPQCSISCSFPVYKVTTTESASQPRGEAELPSFREEGQGGFLLPACRVGQQSSHRGGHQNHRGTPYKPSRPWPRLRGLAPRCPSARWVIRCPPTPSHSTQLTETGPLS